MFTFKIKINPKNCKIKKQYLSASQSNPIEKQNIPVKNKNKINMINKICVKGILRSGSIVFDEKKTNVWQQKI